MTWTILRDPWFILALCFICPPVGLIWFLWNFPKNMKQSRGASLWFLFALLGSFFLLYSALGYFHQILAERKLKAAREDFDYKEALYWLEVIKPKQDLDDLFKNITRAEYLTILGQDQKARELREENYQKLIQKLDLKAVEPVSITSGIKILNAKGSQEGQKKFTILESQPLQRAIEDILLTELTATDPQKFQTLLQRYLGLVENTVGFSRWQNLEFWLGTWQILFSKEEILEKSVNWIYQALSQSPYHLKAYYVRGRLNEVRKDHAAAILDYLHVFSLDVFFLDVKDRLIQLMSRGGREHEVSSVQMFFDSEVSRFRYRDFKDSARRGYELIEIIKKQGPSELLLESKYNLAFLLRVQLGLHQEAIEVLSEILGEDYNLREEQSLYHLGMAKLYLNDLKGSDRAFARLLVRYPSHEHRIRVELLRTMIRILKLVRNVWEDDSDTAR
ncbi:MAG: hypothetical protein H3C47_08525 [Candidatus Cloacimonetes bacterium]|nr:hypothetical protein [Candidatus Cloacimonadota bacterium]